MSYYPKLKTKSLNQDPEYRKTKYPENQTKNPTHFLPLPDGKWPFESENKLDGRLQGTEDLNRWQDTSCYLVFECLPTNWIENMEGETIDNGKHKEGERKLSGG